MRCMFRVTWAGTIIPPDPIISSVEPKVAARNAGLEPILIMPSFVIALLLSLAVADMAIIATIVVAGLAR